jgi:hypothetical protein
MAEESQEAARSTEQVLEDRTSTMRSSQECFDSLARGLASKCLSRGWVPFPQHKEGHFSVILEVYAPPIRGHDEKRIYAAEVTTPAERNEGDP